MDRLIQLNETLDEAIELARGKVGRRAKAISADIKKYGIAHIGRRKVRVVSGGGAHYTGPGGGADIKDRPFKARRHVSGWSIGRLDRSRGK